MLGIENNILMMKEDDLIGLVDQLPEIYSNLLEIALVFLQFY